MEKVLITGESVISGKPIEAFSLSKEKVKLSAGKERLLLDMGGSSFPKRYVNFDWLSACSKVYNISPDIKDYVLVPVGIVTSDIPNRNCQCFALDDLLSFNPNYGCMLYQTFIGKPTFQDHENSILENAKGVNFDASIIPIKSYGLGKVMILSGFDRTKDRELVRDILKGSRNGYSMGALAGHFVCSICGGVLGPEVKRTCTCIGVDYTDLKTLGKVIEGKLLYHIAKNFCFIENSSVSSPADVTAIASPF